MKLLLSDGYVDTLYMAAMLQILVAIAIYWIGMEKDNIWHQDN